MRPPLIDLGVITALFNDVFGTPASAFDPKVAQVLGDMPNYQAKQGVYGSDMYGTDDFGRQVYLPVTIIYTDASGNQVTYELPYPVIEIKGGKHIVDTELTERRGMVSELISTKSFEISIKGFLINTSSDELPEDELMAFRDFVECDAPVSIKCPLTDIWLLRPDRSGTDLVTVRNFELPYVIGVKSVWAYTIELRSEEPFSLIEF